VTRAEARRLRSDEGLSVGQIQWRLGVSKHVLTEWLRGLPPPAWTARPNAKDDVRARAVELRAIGWSVNDIAAELGVARSTAWLWVRDMPLDPDSERATAKRAHSKLMTDARWARHRVERDAAKDAVIASAVAAVGALNDRDVLLLGAAIYWCEGTKSKPWRRIEHLQFVNTDPAIVRLFLRFLELSDVADDRIGFRVSIHESADAASATAWWATVLGVPIESFARPTIKRHISKTNRKNVAENYHGCVVVSVARSRDIYWRIEGVMAAVSHKTRSG
jgi:transposase